MKKGSAIKHSLSVLSSDSDQRTEQFLNLEIPEPPAMTEHLLLMELAVITELLCLVDDIHMAFMDDVCAETCVSCFHYDSPYYSYAKALVVRLYLYWTGIFTPVVSRASRNTLKKSAISGASIAPSAQRRNVFVVEIFPG